MKRSLACTLVALFAVAVVTKPAFGNPNAGAAWLSLAYALTVGTAVIALAEGVALRVFCRVRLRIAIPVMFAANLASAWLGVFALGGVVWIVKQAGLLPIRTELAATIAATLASIPVAVVLEAPFYWLCVRLRRSGERTWRAAFRPALFVNLLANLITGVALILFLATWFNLGLALEFDERTDTGFAADSRAFDHAWVYFVNEAGAVERVRSDGTSRTVRHERLDRPGGETVLHVLREDEDGSTLGLFAYARYSESAPTPVDGGFVAATRTASKSEAVWATPESVPGRMSPGGPAGFDFARVYRASDPVESVANEPLLGENPFWPVHEYGFDTHMGSIGTAYFTDLEGGLYVGALVLEGHRSPHHIVVIDTERGLIGHLARGYSPVVVFEPAGEPPTLSPREAPDEPHLPPDP